MHCLIVEEHGARLCFSMPASTASLALTTGDFDVDVDAVYERAADLLLVAGNGHGSTTAFFDGVAIESTWAPVRVAIVGAI